MAVLWLLAGSEARGWHLVISKALAAEAAILNNFLWNDRWTFRDAEAEVNRRGSRWGRFGWFNLICLAGIGWSVVLLQLQAGWLGMNVYLANLVSIVAVSAWNFGMNLKFGWRMAPSHRSRGTDPEGSGF